MEVPTVEYHRLWKSVNSPVKMGNQTGTPGRHSPPPNEQTGCLFCEVTFMAFSFTLQGMPLKQAQQAVQTAADDACSKARVLHWPLA